MIYPEPWRSIRGAACASFLVGYSGERMKIMGMCLYSL